MAYYGSYIENEAIMKKAYYQNTSYRAHIVQRTIEKKNKKKKTKRFPRRRHPLMDLHNQIKFQSGFSLRRKLSMYKYL